MNGDDQPIRVKFRNRRKALGKTQKQAAADIGVGLRTIQNFESGEASPQPANLRKMLTWAGLLVAPGGEDVEIVERAWPPEISVFLDVLGAYLLRFDETERLRVIHSVTRQIFNDERPTG